MMNMKSNRDLVQRSAGMPSRPLPCVQLLLVRGLPRPLLISLVDSLLSTLQGMGASPELFENLGFAQLNQST